MMLPQAMQIALQRRLRLPLPFSPNHCGPNPDVGEPVDALGDHTLACPRTGLLARRAKVVERAWARIAREAVGAEGPVVPQQWFTYTTVPGVPASDRRRLDLVVFGATAHGGAPCCDATLVSLLTRTGHPQPCTAEADRAALQVAERRKRVAYPAGRRNSSWLRGRGRWRAGAQRFVRDLVRLRALCVPAAVRAAASAGWSRRWWGTRWRSSSRWRAQHLHAHGRRPRNQDRATAASRATLRTPALLTRVLMQGRGACSTFIGQHG